MLITQVLSGWRFDVKRFLWLLFNANRTHVSGKISYKRTLVWLAEAVSSEHVNCVCNRKWKNVLTREKKAWRVSLWLCCTSNAEKIQRPDSQQESLTFCHGQLICCEAHQIVVHFSRVVRSVKARFCNVCILRVKWKPPNCIYNVLRCWFTYVKRIYDKRLG